ncbi:sugar ABC transporter substrate-binding protein [Curtobacterium sp. MCBD17_035]|uniref:ABC transporter substrate-binding protein n=1 Tax=Curtobacterium sp. MCBD17_035 TaxID=2175673 RepID=UPI0015E8E4FA|nr:sugar ABC transporter substrate-binding protein [Curtobacterium sp. MCBD17_035]WIB66847.1 sugar ABC transporter substrate-binding protein [Curtobacterium sp. MCBD17_035]
MTMKTSMTRRTSVAAAALTIAVIGLAGCSASGSAGGGGDAAKGTVTLWQRDGGVDLTDQVKAYEKAHPDVTVKISTIQADQYLTKLANSARAGSVPDLVSYDIVNTPLLATQGLLADVTDKAGKLPDKGDLAPAGVAIGRLDGKQYALPVALTGSQMFWNKSLFEKAGLDPTKPPTSLAEVKAAAEKIQGLGGGVTGFSTLGGVGQAWTGFPSAWAKGGSVLTAAGKSQEAEFTSKNLVGMVDWYQDMWKSGLMQKTDEPNQDPGNVGQENALNGKVGIVFTGANTLTAKKADFGSAVGIPGVDGGSGSFLGGDEIGMTAGAKNSDGAWSLMKWLVSSKKAARIDLSQGWIAPDLTVAKSLATDEWSKDIVDTLAIGKLPKSIAYNAVINDPNGPWAQQSQKVIFQGADASAALASAEKQANALIGQAYSQVGK